MRACVCVSLAWGAYGGAESGRGLNEVGPSRRKGKHASLSLSLTSRLHNVSPVLDALGEQAATMLFHQVDARALLLRLNALQVDEIHANVRRFILSL